MDLEHDDIIEEDKEYQRHEYANRNINGRLRILHLLMRSLLLHYKLKLTKMSNRVFLSHTCKECFLYVLVAELGDLYEEPGPFEQNDYSLSTFKLEESFINWIHTEMDKDAFKDFSNDGGLTNFLKKKIYMKGWEELEDGGN